MLPAVILIAVVAAVIYASRSHNAPVTATASAIKEIWYGHCGRACRYSENAMHSEYHARMSDLNYRGAGPSSGCICGSCPCMLIDNMLTTVSPAMICYSHFISYLSDALLMFARMLNDVFQEAASLFERHQRLKLETEEDAPQTLRPDVGTTLAEERRPKQRELPKPLAIAQEENLSSLSLIKKGKNKAARFDKEIQKENKEQTELKAEPSISKSEPTPLSREQKISDTKLAVAGTSTEPPRQDVPSTTLRIDEADSSSTQVEGVCKKCIERGKICVGLCPRARKPETIDRVTETNQEQRQKQTETTLKEQETKSESKDEGTKQKNRKKKSETALKEQETKSESKDEDMKLKQRKNKTEATLKEQEIKLESKYEETKQEQGKKKPDTALKEQETKSESNDESQITLKPEKRSKWKREPKTQSKLESKSSGLKDQLAGTSSIPKQGEATNTAGIDAVNSETEVKGAPCKRCTKLGKTCTASCPMYKYKTADKSTK